MTDKEIVQALAVCSAYGEKCTVCPAYAEYKKGKRSGLNCRFETMREALEIINRQQAEIERLKTDNLMLSQKRVNLFERLDIVTDARKEAIKEFSERLKEKQQTFTGDEYAYKFIYLIEIDNLVKEMTGDAVE